MTAIFYDERHQLAREARGTTLDLVPMFGRKRLVPLKSCNRTIVADPEPNPNNPVTSNSFIMKRRRQQCLHCGQ